MKLNDNFGEVRVVRSGTCPSLTGKSKLTYELGYDKAENAFVRISKNSGTGFFNDTWVPWTAVQQLLNTNAKKPITSFTLYPLFKGKSVNSAGFLLAALKQEGLVLPMADKPRCYQALDSSAFVAGLTGATQAEAPSKKNGRAKAPATPKTTTVGKTRPSQR